MATERCQLCGHSVRDGVCSNRDCEAVPTVPAVKPAVHRPTAPRSAPPASGMSRPHDDPWPTEHEAEAGRHGLAVARRILAARQPRPESPLRTHLREVSNGLGRPKAVRVAAELLAQFTDLEETRR